MSNKKKWSALEAQRSSGPSKDAGIFDYITYYVVIALICAIPIAVILLLAYWVIT